MVQRWLNIWAWQMTRARIWHESHPAVRCGQGLVLRHTHMAMTCVKNLTWEQSPLKFRNLLQSDGYRQQMCERNAKSLTGTWLHREALNAYNRSWIPDQKLGDVNPNLITARKEQLAPERPVLLRALWVYVTEINVVLKHKRGLIVLLMG